jgi:hypothetical protein
MQLSRRNLLKAALGLPDSNRDRRWDRRLWRSRASFRRRPYAHRNDGASVNRSGSTRDRAALLAWLELKRSTRVPLLAGEKVELVEGFRPYLDNQVLDMIHPDVAYSGGITGCRKIADYAALTRTPMGMHSGPCSLIRFMRPCIWGLRLRTSSKWRTPWGLSGVIKKRWRRVRSRWCGRVCPRSPRGLVLAWI